MKVQAVGRDGRLLPPVEFQEVHVSGLLRSRVDEEEEEAVVVVPLYEVNAGCLHFIIKWTKEGSKVVTSLPLKWIVPVFDAARYMDIPELISELVVDVWGFRHVTYKPYYLNTWDVAPILRICEPDELKKAREYVEEHGYPGQRPSEVHEPDDEEEDDDDGWLRV